MARTTPAERVLLVDDDGVSREVLTLLLETAHYTVHAVSSGEAALAWLREQEPVTVLLTDLQMPGLSGRELATAARRLAGPGVVVIAMSGSEGAPETSSATFDGFLLKPFRASQLAAEIARCRANTAFKEAEPQVESSTQLETASAPEAVAPVLDERIFAQLKEAMPEAPLQQIYALCLSDVRSRITAMRGFAQSGQREPFVRQAHAIKGGCGMLGATELYSLAAALERAGLDAAGLLDNPGVNPLDELSSACHRLERILATRT